MYSSIMSQALLIFMLFGSIFCEEVPALPSKARVIERPQTISVNEGDNVTLPCAIRELSPNDHVVWRRGKEFNLWYVGPMKLVNNPRVSRGPDNSIEIINLRAEDSDIFTCQIGPVKTDNAVTHTLTVKQKPKIVSFSPMKPDGLIVLTRFDTERLTCNAVGKPDPEITWYHVPMNGGTEKRVVGRGNELNFTKIDPRTDSGNYTCQASNIVGDAEQNFELIVRYKPEIEVDNPIMHAGKNADTFLTCRYFGHPEPKVEWTRERDSKRISISEGNFIVNQKKPEASLVIRTTTSDDFDNYTCIAINDLGQALKRIEVVGTPSKPRIVSHKIEYSSNPRYIAEWEVTSNYDVAKYHLRYRTARFNDSVEVPGEWNDLEVSAYANELFLNSNEFVHKGKHTIEDIEIGTNYELQINAENQFGQGLSSDIFQFVVYLPHHQGGQFSSAVSVSSFQFLPLFILTSLASFFALKQNF